MNTASKLCEYLSADTRESADSVLTVTRAVTWSSRHLAKKSTLYAYLIYLAIILLVQEAVV